MLQPEFEGVDLDPVNPIDDIFFKLDSSNEDMTLNLFKVDNLDVFTKSDVIYPEDIIIASLQEFDIFLTEKDLISPYKDFIFNLLRLRVSLDRKSRSEFVDINKKDTMSDGLDKLGTINNLKEVRS